VCDNLSETESLLPRDYRRTAREPVTSPVTTGARNGVGVMVRWSGRGRSGGKSGGGGVVVKTKTI